MFINSSLGIMRYSVLFIVSSLLIACSQTKKTDSSSEITLNAYRLIDEQRTDEAIELIENELAVKPENNELKIVLSSAYAHKAGIKIQSLISLITHSEKLKKINDIVYDVELKKNNGDRVNQGVINISKMFTKLSIFMDAYAAIPSLDKNQSLYLIHAIYILNSIEKKISAEDAMYRAVLEIVLFKYYLAEGLMGEFMEPQVKDQRTCRLDLGRINSNVIKLGKLLIDIYNDIGYSTPSQADGMKKLSLKTRDLISELTVATTSLAVIDEASNLFLKQTAIQNGFGKMIKCGGN